MAKRRTGGNDGKTSDSEANKGRVRRSENQGTDGAPANRNGVMALVRELWQAAVNLRGSIEPPDYKRYVLPIIFLRFLSLRYERRRVELERLIADPKSDYCKDTKALATPDECRSAGAFVVPKKARWDYIVENARADDIKVRLDDALEALEKT